MISLFLFFSIFAAIFTFTLFLFLFYHFLILLLSSDDATLKKTVGPSVTSCPCCKTKKDVRRCLMLHVLFYSSNLLVGRQRDRKGSVVLDFSDISAEWTGWTGLICPFAFLSLRRDISTTPLSDGEASILISTPTTSTTPSDIQIHVQRVCCPYSLACKSLDIWHWEFQMSISYAEWR